MMKLKIKKTHKKKNPSEVKSMYYSGISLDKFKLRYMYPKRKTRHVIEDVQFFLSNEIIFKWHNLAICYF